MSERRGQISLEYIILVGFVSFVIIATLAIAYFYSGSINDRIKVSQINNFGKKIVSTSEEVFYQGEPSKATISVYLPEGVEEVYFMEDILFISLQTSSGVEKVSFSSNVPLDGNISSEMGIKKIQIKAEEENIIVTQI